MPKMLRAAFATQVDVDADARTLSGLVLPVGETGYTSVGPVVVAADATLVFPEALDRVKLVPIHTADNPEADPIGYATAVRRVPEGWRASFHVPESPEGDKALRLAASRLKDGFSVELFNLGYNTRGELNYAEVSVVAHVPVPAFPSARHDGLAASRKETHMPLTDDERNRLRDLLANTTRSEDEQAELTGLLSRATAEEVAELVTPAAPQEAPAAPEAPAQVAASHRPAVVPARPGATTRRNRHTLADLFAAQSRILTGHSRAHLEAALTDITNTDNIWVADDYYAGELWSEKTYAQVYLPNSTPGDLPSYKGVGWRWVDAPEVADYAGDKAAVPSNEVTTEDADWTAARLAGAHDIDRKFYDFGDTEFIAAYYRAMTESYAKKADLKALAFQIASATALATEETSLFRAAAVAAQSVEDTTGSVPDFFYINSADKLDLLDITEADVPAYLQMFGVTPEKFKAVPTGVPAGTVVAGVKQATRFRQLSTTPIRVEAINVANGGIDGGVFGYYATELLQTGGIAKKTWA